MGRGRAKAKQTKVARKLKYYTPDTDLSALQRELGSPSDDPANDYSELADKYSGWEDDEAEDRSDESR